MLEDLHTEVKDRPLSDPLGQVGAKILYDASEDQDPQKEKYRNEQALRISFGDVLVDGDFGEIGPDGLCGAHDNSQKDAKSHMPPVRTEIRQQPPHQASVIGLTEYFFFVHELTQNEK